MRTTRPVMIAPQGTMSSAKHIDADADLKRRALLTQATAAAGGLALAGASVPFIASLAPNDRAKAFGAPVAFDTTVLAPGELVTVSWRGKRVWILRRTKSMLESLESDTTLLADPGSDVWSQQPNSARNESRAIRPEMFICIGLCTHLGCIPNYLPQPEALQANWPGGFYCPGHGSKFDLAGRVFKSVPAPTNLVIPPYTFVGAASVDPVRSDNDAAIDSAIAVGMAGGCPSARPSSCSSSLPHRLMRATDYREVIQGSGLCWACAGILNDMARPRPQLLRRMSAAGSGGVPN